MCGPLRGFGSNFWALAAVVALGVLPGSVRACWLGFRNDLNVPVIVQGSSVVNKVVRQGKPHLLYPGEVSWDCILQPGVKAIRVYDAKARGRVLYEGPVTCGAKDLLFSVTIDSGPPPRAVLAPAKLPMAMPGRMSR
jgi:hypothetical protein